MLGNLNNAASFGTRGEPDAHAEAVANSVIAGCPREDEDDGRQELLGIEELDDRCSPRSRDRECSCVATLQVGRTPTLLERTTDEAVEAEPFG